MRNKSFCGLCTVGEAIDFYRVRKCPLIPSPCRQTGQFQSNLNSPVPSSFPGWDDKEKADHCNNTWGKWRHIHKPVTKGRL